MLESQLMLAQEMLYQLSHFLGLFYIFVLDIKSQIAQAGLELVSPAFTS